jgi:hypothetical protein
MCGMKGMVSPLWGVTVAIIAATPQILTPVVLASLAQAGAGLVLEQAATPVRSLVKAVKTLRGVRLMRPRWSVSWRPIAQGFTGPNLHPFTPSIPPARVAFTGQPV